MLFVLETLFLILTGIVLLRISGRKSISQDNCHHRRHDFHRNDHRSADH